MGSSSDPVFNGCTALSTVTIGENVKNIPDYAFKGSTRLTSITIPNSVTSIGYEAFYKCSSLTSITIPNSVTRIGDFAFYDCYGLNTVINLSNLTFSKGSSDNGSIAYYADKVINALNGSIEGDFIFGKPNDANTLLYYLGNAAELSLPANYKGENYAVGNEVFRGCNGLTSVVIPNSVTSIGDYAFCGCSNLETLYISSAIESIGNYAFAECDKIVEIKVGAEKPIRGNTNIFTYTVYDNATLYVPTDTEQLYQKREPWNLFFYIVEMDFTGIDDVKAESGEENGIYYDLNGRAVENPANGIYILNGKKVLVK